jgi:hypothetical protein
MSLFQVRRSKEKARFPVSLLCKIDGRGFEERLLRLEGETALEEEPRGCHPHGEDPRGPSEKQG